MLTGEDADLLPHQALAALANEASGRLVQAANPRKLGLGLCLGCMWLSDELLRGCTFVVDTEPL
jgi:hypothetical protein